MRQREINIGKLCNNDCVFCSNGQVPVEERAWISRDVVVSEIEQAAKEGFLVIGFLGGEPTIRKDFVEIVRQARAVGIQRVALCTNGRKLRDRAYLEQILDAGVTRITLSIHSHRRDVEDTICQRAGAYDQKLEAIAHLVALADRLPDGFALNTCIHGKNLSELVELSSFFSRLGVTEIRFNLIRPEHLVVSDKSWIPRLAVVTKAIARTMRWSLGTGRIDLSFSDIPLCVYPRDVLLVPSVLRRFMGELRDLDTTVVVHRGDRRDLFAWLQRRRDKLKSQTDRCSGCALADLCEGPWVRYLDLYGDGDLRPFSEQSAALVRNALVSDGDVA